MKQKFSDLKRRFLVSLGLVVFVAAMIYLSIYPIVEILITLFIAVVAAVASWEFCQFCTEKKLRAYKRIIVSAAVLEILACYLSMMFPWAALMPLAVFILAVFLLFLMHFNKIDSALASISCQVFGLIYITVPLGMILGILYPELTSHFSIQDGRLWFAYLIAVTKFTDIGAYFGGRMFGNRLLAKVLSPKKTWEGAALGFIVSIVVSLFFAFVANIFQLQSFELGFVAAIFLGGAISVASQLGDLSESLIKRDANIKDSNSLPGLGGLLDTLDSLLFSIPVLYFYLHIV